MAVRKLLSIFTHEVPTLTTSSHFSVVVAMTTVMRRNGMRPPHVLQGLPCALRPHPDSIPYGFVREYTTAKGDHRYHVRGRTPDDNKRIICKITREKLDDVVDEIIALDAHAVPPTTP